MSLFLFQQKIPFNSVFNFLRAFEPECPLSPEGWARQHAQDIAPGDLVFTFEPIYSPWSDSSSGLGVAEGDSFNVSSMVIAHKWENGLAGYVVKPDAFERHSVEAYLAQEAATAKNNGGGFYYALCRPSTAMPPDVMRDLAELDSFGTAGWRKDDNQPIDIVYAFCTAASWGVMVHPGQQPDIAQIGYSLFCDKEVPSGSTTPDLRAHLQPINKDQHREPAPEFNQASSMPVAEEPAPVPPPMPTAPPPMPTAAAPEAPRQMQLPKMPAFFKQGGGKGRNAGGGSSAPVPPMPGFTDGSEAVEDEHNLETMERPALSPADMLAPAPPPLPEASSAPVPPPLPGGGSSHSMPPPLPSMPSAAQLEEPLPMPSDQPMPPPLAAPRSGVDMSIFAPMDDEAPAEAAPEAPPEAAHPVPPPMPSHSAPHAQPHVPAPGPIRFSASKAAAPPPAPAPVPAAEVPPAAQPAPMPTPSAESSPSMDGQSANGGDIPSLAELLGNISRAGEASKAAAGGAPVAPQTPGQPSPQASEPAAASQSAQAPVTATNEPNIVMSGPPTKRKGDQEREVQARPLKEPITVKSGVAGLVSKLEQQASKASSRLEAQVDEIQSRLSTELSEMLAKVTSSESRSIRNAQDLRAELTERMDATTTEVVGKISTASKDGSQRLKERENNGSEQLNEKLEYVRTSLSGSFDEVRARAEAIVKTFQETLLTRFEESGGDLDKLRDTLTEQLSALFTEYEVALQKAFDNYKNKLDAANTSVSATIESRCGILQGQLADLHARSSARLAQIRQTYVNQLNRQFAATQAEVRKLRATLLEETVIPRLRQHRDELRIMTNEFQAKLADDLEKKSEEKLADFDPILAEKKQKLIEVLQSTAAVKDQMEEHLRQRLQQIARDLEQFVQSGVDEAQTAYKETEEQLAEIDRAVRGLADPSSIEGDLELLNERNQVLAAMDEATENAKEEVLGTLRTSLASLEEKGKQLQEELISSMEEDAYRVRRASEQALIAIRQAIKDAFKAIQTAQDERMPM